jgi:hypothetical protein
MLITWQVRANDGAHLYHCAVRSDVVNASLRARPTKSASPMLVRADERHVSSLEVLRRHEWTRLRHDVMAGLVSMTVLRADLLRSQREGTVTV